MAQHIPMHLIENKSLQQRARKIKAQGKITPYGSMKWQQIEKGRMEYIRGIKVPEKIVSGGRADVEVTTDEQHNILEVYLVA